MKRTARYWIEKLDLQEHPEGGFFRETYRASEEIAAVHLPERYEGSRSFCTAIYFLLRGDQISAFHRLQSDELWFFQAGSSLTLSVIEPTGELATCCLGNEPDKNERLQCILKAGCWFAARSDDRDSFSLVSCTVAPGFDFRDFELADRQNLANMFPQHKQIIQQLTV